METVRLKRSLAMTALTMLVLCAALTSATYAWFTFDPYTNVTPMEGKIARGDTNLLISEQPDDGFDIRCGLNPTHRAGALAPVSTASLDRFFASIAQNREGISTNFADVTANPAQWLIHGTVYLKCQGVGCDVYFDRETLDFGADGQILASARLGLKITVGDNQTITYIFHLDAMGITTGVNSRKTVAPDGAVVVAAVDGGGLPTFQNDPAVSIGNYMIDRADANALLTLQTGEVARVEYWLYLEGCDPECHNPVQNRDVILKLGFAGNQLPEEA